MNDHTPLGSARPLLPARPTFPVKTIAVKDALRRYGVGRTKLYELLGAGVIKASKLGTKTLIDVAAADTFFESLPAFREK